MKRICLLIIVTFVFSPTLSVRSETSEKLLFEKNSLYQYISVVENTVKKERYVRNQKKDYAQGGIIVDAPDKLLFEFTQLVFISLAFLDREPKDVLFVGLGAGAMPKYFNKHYPDGTAEIAEIDPDMVDVARKYFFFKESGRMKAHVEDGRIFIKRAKKKYDMIFLDAYQNDYIPFHLTTAEFLREVKSKLKEDGVVVSNITSPFRNKLFDSMVMTYRNVFPHVYIFKGKKSANFVFVATAGSAKKDRDAIMARAERIQAQKKFDIDLPDMASRYAYSSEYAYEAAKVLTDDFAPVNLYRFQKSGAP